MTHEEYPLLELLETMAQMPPPGDPDQVVLTPKQRAYLRGKEPDIPPSTERTRRRSIRDRISTAFIDLAIAFEHLGEDDRAQLLLRREGSTSVLQDYGSDENLGPPELRWSFVPLVSDDDVEFVATGGLRQSIGLCALSLHDALVKNLAWSDERYVQLLEQLVGFAVQDAMMRSGRVSSVDVDIDLTDRDELPESADSIDDLHLLYTHRDTDAQEYRDRLEDLVE